MTGYLLSAFIYLCAAVVAVPVAKRLGLGSVLGYLIAGVAISPILQLLKVDVVSIQHFAEFGVVMMLFLVVEYIQIGKVAPNFVTVGIYKNRLGQIRLSDYHGKKYVILLFYPANFTSIYSTELINFSERISEFRRLSTQILALSGDSPFSHLQYLLLKRSQGGLGHLNYPLVSDLNQKIANKYKLLTNNDFPSPGIVILDKEGIIQYYTTNNLLCGRSVNELLRVLKAIQ